MKKTAFLIAFLIIVQCFLVVPYAASDENLIYVSDFRFEDEFGTPNVLCSNSDVYAKCNIERIDSDIDVALSLSLDLTEKEKEQILKELKEYFYKSFKRFVDIHEVMDIIHQDFIKKAVNIIKIY